MTSGEILQHYGIVGMKWGVRRGPPYPIGSNGGFRSSKKENGSIRSKEANSKKSKINAKDVAKIAAIVGGGVATVVAIRFAMGVAANWDEINDLLYYDARLIKRRVDDLVGSDFPLKMDPVEDTIESIRKDLRDANPEDGTSNCVGCSIAYELRRRGFDVSSKADYGEAFRTEKMQRMLFKDLKIEEHSDLADKTASEAFRAVFDRLSQYPDGARGGLTMHFSKGIVVGFGVGGHQTTWQKINGEVKILDPQVGRIFTLDEFLSAGTRDPNDFFDPGGFETTRLDNLELDINMFSLIKHMIGTTGKG